jgi:hypothetical protein
MRTRSHVHSQDPRKPAIVEALRNKAKRTASTNILAGRVTGLTETANGFEAMVFIKSPGESGYGLPHPTTIGRSEVG